LFIFFIFFLAPAYGAGVAELILRIIGRKQGKLVEILGVTMFVIGGMIPIIHDVTLFGMRALLEDWRQFLGIGLAAAALYSRLKFF
jgi:hypothetical protein